MANLINLVPDLVKQIPGGIQALLFADRFIQWREYKNLIDGMGVPNSIKTTTFLKLGLIKYAYNLPATDTLEISADRISFRTYINYHSPSAYLVSEIRKPFEYFVSAYGNLGELLKFIDDDLKKQTLILNRKIKPGTSCLVPYLSKLDNPNDNPDIAIWL